MFAEPTFIVSVSGLCGFILVLEDGTVDAYTQSGDLLGVFGDRIDAAEAVLRCGVHIGRLNQSPNDFNLTARMTYPRRAS